MQNVKLDKCEQLERLATKCHIANTEDAKSYILCQACALYVRYIAQDLPTSIRRNVLASNKVTDIWHIVADFEPGLEINRDALDTVEKYLLNPLSYHASTGEMKAVTSLLKTLSDIAHN